MTPAVRDQAARAARDVYYADRPEHEYWPWLRVVDAVVAVVAPEITRPLQERAEHAEALIVEEVAHVRQLEAACDQLQGRITELEELAGMWESRAKEVDAHRRALWDITGRDPKVWSEAHARAVLAKGGKP